MAANARTAGEPRSRHVAIGRLLTRGRQRDTRDVFPFAAMGRSYSAGLKFATADSSAAIDCGLGRP